MRPFLCSLALVGCFALCRPIRAEDAFYEIPLRELRLTAGSLPSPDNGQRPWVGRTSVNYAFPNALLERGEAFLGNSGNANGQPQNFAAPDTLYARVPATANADVSGQLFLPKSD